jgi:hypothetical protein
MFAHQHIDKVLDAGGIEGEKPVARFPHNGLASEVIEFQNQVCIFLFAHRISPWFVKSPGFGSGSAFALPVPA